MATVTFDEVLTTTTYKYASKSFNDQVFEGLKAFKVLMAKPGFKQIEDGGTFITVPLDLQSNPTPAWIGEWDEINNVNRETANMGQWNWRQMGGTIDVSYQQMWKNNGEAAVLNLVQHKIDNLKNSMLTSWSTSLFSDGSNFGGLEIDGLEAICSTSNPSVGNYGKIDRTTNTAWQSNVDSTSTVLNASDMEHMYNLCAHNIQAPDLIITSQALYEKYIDMNRGLLRFDSNANANLGFDNVMYKGAVVIYDKLCGANNMYFLNSQKLRLIVHKDADFKVDEPRTPLKAFAVSQPISWFGNLIALQCRMQGKLANRTAA